jgi:hypothetical protein
MSSTVGTASALSAGGLPRSLRSIRRAVADSRLFTAPALPKWAFLRSAVRDVMPASRTSELRSHEYLISARRMIMGKVLSREHLQLQGSL